MRGREIFFKALVTVRGGELGRGSTNPRASRERPYDRGFGKPVDYPQDLFPTTAQSERAPIRNELVKP